MNIIETIKTNINELCTYKGVTPHEVCKAIGVADGYFRRNREDFPLSVIIELASYFKIEPQKLWDGQFTDEIKKMALDAEIERLTAARKAMDTPTEIMTPPQEEKHGK